MKRTIFIIATLVIMGVGASAQENGERDCNAILQPFYTLNGINAEDYPVGKAAYRCRYSEMAFYFVDDIPNGVPLYRWNELTDLLTNQHPAADMVVDLNTLSYYRYDFSRFQGMNRKSVVYFRLRGNNQHQFLAVRPLYEIESRVWENNWMEPEN